MALPAGRAGTIKTLGIMRALANEYKKNIKIRELALALTSEHAQKDYMGSVRAIHNFVRDRIRFVPDVLGVETLQTPTKTLEYAAGDCDDKAVLAASLLLSIGRPVRYHAISFSPGKFSHVFVDANINGHWVPMETTEPWPLGRYPTGAVNHLLVTV